MTNHVRHLSILIAICFFYSFECQSQNNGAAILVDEKQLLVDILPSDCHFSGSFSQSKAIVGLPQPLKSSGNFFYSCDLGLVWNTTLPFNEALLYVNASNNYRVDERGRIERLSGTARYIMSRIFVRMLKGDIEYFADEFTVTLAPDGVGTKLIPYGEFMKKGIQEILIKKHIDPEKGVSINAIITETTGQDIKILIEDIKEFAISGKKAAFERCKSLYSPTPQWCRLLRSPNLNDR